MHAAEGLEGDWMTSQENTIEKVYWFFKGYAAYVQLSHFGPPSTVSKEQYISWFEGWEQAVIDDMERNGE